MATTVEQIIEAALATSKKNQRGATASDTGELLPLVQRSLRGFFAEGARANRKFYGKKFDVAFSAGGWARPDEAEMIVRIEAGAGVTKADASAIAAGTRIVEVPFDQRRAEPGLPAIYEYGQVFYAAGNAPDPVAGTLTFFGSARPADLTALTSTLDVLWPEQFNSLLILDVARYLAIKDGNRPDEVAAFAEEYKRERDRYVAFLQHETTTEVKSYGHLNRMNDPGVNVG